MLKDFNILHLCYGFYIRKEDFPDTSPHISNHSPQISTKANDIYF